MTCHLLEKARGPLDIGPVVLLVQRCGHDVLSIAVSNDLVPCISDSANILRILFGKDAAYHDTGKHSGAIENLQQTVDAAVATIITPRSRVCVEAPERERIAHRANTRGMTV